MFWHEGDHRNGNIENRTKAQMLKYLEENITGIYILPLYILQVE